MKHKKIMTNFALLALIAGFSYAAEAMEFARNFRK